MYSFNYLRAIIEIIIQSESAAESENDVSLWNCCNNCVSGYPSVKGTSRG